MEQIHIRTTGGLFHRRTELAVDENSLVIYKRAWFGRKMKKSSIIALDTISAFNLPKKNKRIYIFEDKFHTLPENLNGKQESEKDLDLDKKMVSSISIHKFRLKKSDDSNPLIEILNKGTESQWTVRKSSGLLFKQYIALNKDWLLHITRKKIECVPIKEMAFFITNRSKLYCGYHAQISAKVKDSSLRKQIKDVCYKESKRLNTSDGKTFRLAHSEHIIISDTAIIYKKSSFFKSEMAYVPYERVNYVCFSKGLLLKKLFVIGEQNIIPRHKLWRGQAARINDGLKGKITNITRGHIHTYSSSILKFKNWFGRSPRVVCSNDYVLYYPNRLEGKSTNEGNLSIAAVSYDKIKTVHCHKKPHSRFGTITIWGRQTNIRNDQTSEWTYIVIPQLYRWNYWLLKRRLKKLSNAEVKNYDSEYNL